MLTLESAKSYLKIDFDDMDEDIANLIMEAEAVVFASTGILAEEVDKSNNGAPFCVSTSLDCLADDFALAT